MLFNLLTQLTWSHLTHFKLQFQWQCNHYTRQRLHQVYYGQMHYTFDTRAIVVQWKKNCNQLTRWAKLGSKARIFYVTFTPLPYYISNFTFGKNFTKKSHFRFCSGHSGEESIYNRSLFYLQALPYYIHMHHKKYSTIGQIWFGH